MPQGLPSLKVLPYLFHHRSSNLTATMPVFQRKTFRPTSSQNTIAATYRRHLARHPFLLFGLPFITTMVAGSFFLTPATALRYERHDRKMRRLSEEEKMGLKQDLEGGAKGRKVRDVDAAEEYYRLSAKDLDDWENKRVERFKGEPDGVM
ncbi:cytochrome c oxidase assembly protein cox16 [Physcia stellaris]|nr:cytochrome c oxidase assembly protein cox16 [Physcia stellaris]